MYQVKQRKNEQQSLRHQLIACCLCAALKKTSVGKKKEMERTMPSRTTEARLAVGAAAIIPLPMQAKILVKARDRFSNPVTRPYPHPSQADFQIEVAGPGGPLETTWDLTSSRTGELAAAYLPVQTGLYTVAVKHRGKHVHASPYQVSLLCCVMLCCAVLRCAVPCRP